MADPKFVTDKVREICRDASGELLNVLYAIDNDDDRIYAADRMLDFMRDIHASILADVPMADEDGMWSLR